MCYTASFDGNLRARAPQLFNTESLAFCDGAGDSTVDSLGRRVCYCGENMEKDNAGVCRACPAGKFRSVGGTKSKNEVCSCPTCPDASVGRMLAGQEPATSLTLAQLKDACGAVCKAEPYSAEPALAVSAMVPQFNADGEWDSLKVTWSGATSNSLLKTAGYKVRLSMYQLTGATAQNVSALWWWNPADETDETKYYSASAGGGTVTIPYDWQADFDAQQPPVNVEGYCADNNFVALELLDASGAVVTTVYSPPFFYLPGLRPQPRDRHQQYGRLRGDCVPPQQGRRAALRGAHPGGHNGHQLVGDVGAVDRRVGGAAGGQGRRRRRCHRHRQPR